MDRQTLASDRIDTPFESVEDLRKSLDSFEKDPGDSALGRFRQKIGKIRVLRRNDRILLLLLWMLDSVGTYIASNRERAHPGAKSLLRSLYRNLQPLILNADTPEEEKEKVLIDQVKKYRDLRTRIALEKSESEPEMGETHMPSTGALETQSPALEENVAGSLDRGHPVEREEQDQPPVNGRKASQTPREAFVATLEEVKRSIRAEFRALRDELEQWRDL